LPQATSHLLLTCCSHHRRGNVHKQAERHAGGRLYTRACVGRHNPRPQRQVTHLPTDSAHTACQHFVPLHTLLTPPVSVSCLITLCSHRLSAFRASSHSAHTASPRFVPLHTLLTPPVSVSCLITLCSHRLSAFRASSHSAHTASQRFVPDHTLLTPPVSVSCLITLCSHRLSAFRA
jgi:hypothetical protein